MASLSDTNTFDARTPEQKLNDEIAQAAQIIKVLLITYRCFHSDVHYLSNGLAAYVEPEIKRINAMKAVTQIQYDVCGPVVRQCMNMVGYLQLVTALAERQIGKEQFKEIARHNVACQMCTQWLCTIPCSEFDFRYWLTGFYLVQRWVEIVLKM